MSKPKHSVVDFKKWKEKYSKFKDKIKSKLKDLNIKTFNKKDKKAGLKNLYIRLVFSGLLILILIGLGTTAYNAEQERTAAFKVYLGEDKVGIIRNEEEALSIVEDLKTELSKAYNMDVALNKEIEFEETNAKDNLLTPNEDLKDNIKTKMDFKVYGYTLEVEGKEIGSLKTKEELESILDKIKEPYETIIEEDKELKQIEFVEDIKITKQKMKISDIGNSQDIEETLLTSSEQIRTHVVEVGESFWTIALFYDMTVEELIDANPEKNPDALQIGDEVRLVIPKPVVTVATVSELEYTEEIKYETEIEYDDDMYNIHSKTKVAGANGFAKIVANEIKHNGFYIDREIVKEEIIEAPVKEIIVKGTKEPPKTMATGTFLMPTRGRISSRYGMRNGRMHRGLDIAARSGTDIKAADGGKVVFSGYRGAYGNLVEVDHENGYKTRYAHNSKILVKVGERVYKGQTIAKMGSTGRSTGSHLHFEVLVNGSNKNPSNYVK